MTIKNFNNLATTETRRQALLIAEAGFAAIDTSLAVEQAVKFDPQTGELVIQGKVFDLAGFRSVVLVAFGKAAFDAASQLQKILGQRLNCGFVVDLKAGQIGNLTCSVGTHPFPTAVNVKATQQIKSFLNTLNEKDLVLCVVSGGGSSLLCDPYQMTCETQTLLVKALMHRGATIEEMNLVRKHLDNVKGGQLAAAAYPAKVVNLVFSDVPGGTLDMVASGPTVYDPTTISEAAEVLKKYHVLDLCQLPTCQLIETPKDKSLFEKVESFLLVDAQLAARAMRDKALDLGLRARIASIAYSGEARDLGKTFLTQTEAGEVTIWCGESTVTVRTPGHGGRNLELALGALNFLTDEQLVLALNSDGFDNTPFAGALADSETERKAKLAGLDHRVFLEQNSSFNFFEQVGDFVDTGLTGANVADFVIVFG